MSTKPTSTEHCRCLRCPSIGRLKTIGFLCGSILVLLGVDARLFALDTQKAAAEEFMRRVPRGQVPPLEISQAIQDKLLSSDKAAQISGIILALSAGRQLAGTPAVGKLCDYFHVAEDNGNKYLVVRALSTIADSRTRPFFSELIRSTEPVSSRIAAVKYLVDGLDLRRDECEASVSTLLEGLNYSTTTKYRAGPSEPMEAWVTLSNMVIKYRLPDIVPADDTREARAKAATEWWQRERDAVIGKLPKGPKLLRIGSPPHAVYDWDEGIAIISERINSKDEKQCRQGIGMAMTAGKQLVGTSIVALLQTAESTWAKAGASSFAITIRHDILEALIAIDDPASRPWFVKQLEPSVDDVGMRLVAARYLSATLQPTEAESVVQVVCDVAAIDDHPRYGGRTLEAVRKMASETISNVAKTKKSDAVLVDWHQDSTARVKRVRDWWGTLKNQAVPQTQGS